MTIETLLLWLKSKWLANNTLGDINCKLNLKNSKGENKQKDFGKKLRIGGNKVCIDIPSFILCPFLPFILPYFLSFFTLTASIQGLQVAPISFWKEKPGHLKLPKKEKEVRKERVREEKCKSSYTFGPDIWMTPKFGIKK